MTTRPLRASDQDRQEAVLALADAYADGRLDADEFEARQSRALVATYLHDLDPLFDDLPARVAPASRPVPVVAPPRRSPGLAAARVVAVLLAVGVAVLLVGGHALWLLVPLAWIAMASRRRHAWRAVAAARAGELDRFAGPGHRRRA